MKYFILSLQLLWRFWFFLHGALVIIIFYPVYFVLLQRKEWFPQVFKLYKICARLMLFNAGIFPKVIRKYVPEKNKPYVICPNHASYLDIVTTYVAVSDYFHFMGKAELKNIPLFGHFFKEMNIPVDRNSIRDSHRAYKRACDDIDKGISVTIFPEATIPETAPKLKSFKNGAFKLAIEKQVPILPVIYLDNHKIMPDGILRRMTAGYPGITRMVIHHPIETKGMKEADLPVLKNKVLMVLEEELYQSSLK
ncbi:MAG: lysophospholipid acyltransferase family protein [Bacteroidia bacterium]